MAVPTSINDLSTTAALNAPAGSDSPSILDDVQRAHAAFIAQLRANTGFVTPKAALGANTDITSMSAIASINGGQIAGLRNRLMNGNMQVLQRGSSGTFTSGSFTADRWYAYTTGTAPAWSVFEGAIATFGIAAAPIFSIDGAAGNTGVALYQKIESANCRDLAGSTVTLSYLVFQSSGATMTCGAQVRHAVAKDNFTSTTSIIDSLPQTVPSGVWTKVSMSFALPSGAWAGLQIGLTSSSPILAGKLLYITNAQLELGAVATAFEQRPYSLELSLCQWYYDVMAYQVNSSWTAGNSNGNALTHQMRVTPSIGAVNFSAGTGATFVGVNNKCVVQNSAHSANQSIASIPLSAEL